MITIFPQYRFLQLPVPVSLLLSTENGTRRKGKNQQNRAFPPSTVRGNCYLDSGYRGALL
jgi:hypothetical protein